MPLIGRPFKIVCILPSSNKEYSKEYNKEHMYFRIIVTLALSFVFYVANSQVSYHRLYETTLNDPSGMNDTIFYHMSSTTISGDIYAMGTKRVGDSASDYEDLSVIFTSHDNKGNINWSRELDLGIDTIKILDSGNVGRFEFNGTQDSILFVLDVEINGQRSEIFGKLDAGGNQLDLRTVGGLIFSDDNGFPNVAPFINQSDLLLTTGEQPIISRIGLGNDLIWSRSYTFTNSNGDPLLDRITDMTTTEDSTIVITGKSDVVSTDFMVAELDSNGVQLWAESYTFPIADLENIVPEAIKPLTNGNFAVAGRYLSGGDISTNGFVSVIDTAGSILSANKIFITENLTGISNLIEGDDGTLWMSGEYVMADTVEYFTTNMNLDGTINWTTIYPGQNAGFGPRATSLLNVQATGGATLVGHGFLDDLPVLRVMKHDVEGSAMCSDTITITLEDLMVTEDTLTTSVENGGIFFDSLDFELNTFVGFTPPVLSINQYPPFCPNEPIDTILVASVSGVADENISYMWSTEEFTDTIRVMEEGQYSVTVTIVEDVCYMMCDTVELTRLMLPQIDIAQDNSRFCEEMIVILNSIYTPGASGQMYTWSTSETTPSIEVTEAGVYSVTVVDDCGEMASANIDITLPVFNPEVFFGASVVDFCVTGTATVTAAYTGGGNQPEFIWSDGQMGNPIIVSTPGTYSVTVTDECGFSATFEDDVNFPEIPTEAEITAVPNCDLEKIVFDAGEDNNVILSVFVIEEEGTRTLVTNPANSFDLGNYIVFARDICNNILDSLISNSAAACGGLLQYPIAFFPGGQDESSTTFGPIPNDTLSVDLISGVEFKVFNRWGETVFESNAILEAWDGTHKGEPAPSEVYIWYVSYIIDGQQMLDKGDVTLIR